MSEYRVGGSCCGAERSDWTVPLLLAAFLSLVAFYSHLLFHTLAELFAVMVAILAAVVAWHTYLFSRNHFLMYLASGYFWVGGVDLVHTLTYQGMGVYGFDTSAHSIQFWLIARYLEAILLVTAPLFLRREFRPGFAFALFGAAAISAYRLVMVGWFPVAFVEGVGLTRFKVFSEYLIIAVLAGAFAHLWKRRSLLDGEIVRLMVLSIAFTIIAEFCFTLYEDLRGPPTVVGHIFKLFSFWFIFVAVVRTTLKEPFRIIARGASTYDAVPDATIVVDRDGIVRQTNRAARRFANRSEEECLGQHCHELFHPEELMVEECPVCALLREGKGAESVELEFGRLQRRHQITLSPIREGRGLTGMVHVSRDITERWRSEEMLRRSEGRLAESQRIACMGSWEWEIGSDTVYWSDQLYRIFGITPGEFAATRDAYLAMVHPEDRQTVKARIAAALLGEPYTVEYRIVLPDGRIRHIRGEGRLVRDAEGRPLRMMGIAQDISQRKTALDVLRQSEQRFRNLVETMTDWVWEVDEEGRYTYVSPRVRDILGYEVVEVLGKRPFDLMPAQEAQRLSEHFRALVHERRPIVGLENLNLHKDGREVVLETNGVPYYDSEGRFCGYRGIDRDVTERRRAEQVLRESERKYRTLLDNLPLSVFLKDRDSVYVSCNNNYATDLHIAPEEVVGKSDYDFFPLWLADKYTADDRRVMASGRKEDIEEAYIKDGRELVVHTLKAPVTDDAGTVVGVLGIFWDITEQKRAQDVLRMSEARYRAIVEDQTEFIVRFLPDGRLTFANDAFARYLGCERERVIGQDFLSWIPPRQRGELAELIGRLGAEQPFGHLELVLPMSGASPRSMHWTFRAIPNMDGKTVEVQGTGRDITELKEAEEGLRRALEEKEALLREVHHRVKNNMQVISSLLGLEARRTGDPEASALFREAENRIRSMSLVHERLYRCRDLSRIDFGGYVRDLVSHLARAFAAGERIAFRFDIEEVPVALEHAIPYGLMVNELVSNALKHAFPGGAEGWVEIRLQETRQGLVLAVADNGVGLPPVLDWRRVDTLGLRLVRQLAEKQLRGRLTVQVDNGTEWCITMDG